MISKSAPAYFAVTSRGLRTDTRFRHLKRSRDWRAALELPLYHLFYEGDDPPPLPNLSKRQTTEELVLDAEQEKELRFYEKVKRLLTRIDEKDRQLLLYMAQKLASR